PEDKHEEEGAIGFVGKRVADAEDHVSAGAGHPEQRAEQHDDVARSPVAERQRAVEPHDEDADSDQVDGAERIDPARDVVRYVKEEQEDREQGGHGQRDIAIHLAIPWLVGCASGAPSLIRLIDTRAPLSSFHKGAGATRPEVSGYRVMKSAAGP